MKLRYHQVTIKVRSPYMPMRFWKHLLKSMKIVYAAYGIKRDNNSDPHLFFMLYEDDAYLRSYARHLEKNKALIFLYREEHDLSEVNLRKIRAKYEKICPKDFQIDNIAKYFK